ncbi:unnamed protein product [Allacma fusca]|uniref:Transmembrane protein n=1 Tax=Allacma fusca TaxID=39272 RepID=A0A8J2J2Q0_9HEXA|nr:unnamed protein product [Allacma fusca]
MRKRRLLRYTQPSMLGFIDRCLASALPVFACVTGNGGWVNSFLSWKPQAVHSSVYNTIYLFFAHMVMSGLVAYLLTTSVETPFMQLEKMLFASQLQPKLPKPIIPEVVVPEPEDTQEVDEPQK